MADKVQRGGVAGVIKGVYHDPFSWSVMKSVALFLVGVRIARECIGMDLMVPPM